MRMFWSDPHVRWDSTSIIFILTMQLVFSFFFMLVIHDSLWSKVSTKIRMLFEKCNTVLFTLIRDRVVFIFFIENDRTR